MNLKSLFSERHCTKEIPTLFSSFATVFVKVLVSPLTVCLAGEAFFMVVIALRRDL
jgi:hypothetical protein